MAGGQQMARRPPRIHAVMTIVAVVTATIMTATIMMPSHARAAGAAYQVDTVEVSEAGACKVESWLSWASNRDFIAAASPACAFQIVRPIELSMQINRSRADDVWTSGLTPKAKVNLLPSGIGTWRSGKRHSTS